MIKRTHHNEYVFSIFAKLLSFGLGVVYSVVYSRYLQPDLRGRVSIIQNYATLIMLFFCLGINQGYPFFRKRDKDTAYMIYINTVFAFFLLYLFVGIVLSVLISPSLDWQIVIVLIPLLFIIKELNYVVLIERPFDRNKMSIFLSIFDIVYVLAFYFLFKASLAIVLLFVVTKEIVYTVVAMRQIGVKLSTIKPSFLYAKEYIQFGFFPMLTVIMMEINYKADVLMLDAFQVSKASIGIYTLAVSLAEKIWLIPDAMKDILVSQLAKGKGETEVCKVTRFSVCIVMVLSIVFIIFGRPVINMLYGSSYHEVFEIIIMLLVGIIGMVFYKTVYSFNVTQGKRIVNFILLSIASITNVVANYYLIPRYSIYGAAFASSISYFVCGLIFLGYFCQKTKTAFSKMVLIKKEDIENMKRTVLKNS